MRPAHKNLIPIGLVLLFSACGSDGGATAGDAASPDGTASDALASEASLPTPDATARDGADLAADVPAPSSDATLAALAPTVGDLVPAFAADVTAYSVELPFGTIAAPALVATAHHPSASVAIDGAADVTSTDAASRTSTVTVTAEDGTTTATYSVRFDVSPHKTLHDFQVTDIHGQPFDLATLKGRKVLVVNVASYCGFTPQYPKIQQLYDTYGPDAFTVIGFPANNFNAQEPGTDQEICDFAVTKYGITFPLMSKISVKGADIHPVYAWLTQKSENGVLDAPVQWNFQKFLVGPDGKVDDVALPPVDPLSAAIVDWITAP